MSPDEMFEVFGEFDPSDYEEEVASRWGKTGAYAESARRPAAGGLTVDRPVSFCRPLRVGLTSARSS